MLQSAQQGGGVQRQQKAVVYKSLKMGCGCGCPLTWMRGVLVARVPYFGGSHVGHVLSPAFTTFSSSSSIYHPSRYCHLRCHTCSCSPTRWHGCHTNVRFLSDVTTLPPASREQACTPVALWYLESRHSRHVRLVLQVMVIHCLHPQRRTGVPLRRTRPTW